MALIRRDVPSGDNISFDFDQTGSPVTICGNSVMGVLDTSNIAVGDSFQFSVVTPSDPATLTAVGIAQQATPVSVPCLLFGEGGFEGFDIKATDPTVGGNYDTTVRYVLISSLASGSAVDYYVWWDRTGSQTDPSIAGRTGIKVDITTAALLATSFAAENEGAVTEQTVNAINAIAGANMTASNTWGGAIGNNKYTSVIVDEGQGAILNPISVGSLPGGAALERRARGGVNDNLVSTLTKSKAFTGTLSIGSPTISVADTTDIIVGETIEGTGIPTESLVVSVVTNTSVTITQNATAAGAQSLTSSPFPLFATPSRRNMRFTNMIDPELDRDLSTGGNQNDAGKLDDTFVRMISDGAPWPAALGVLAPYWDLALLLDTTAAPSPVGVYESDGTTPKSVIDLLLHTFIGATGDIAISPPGSRPTVDVYTEFASLGGLVEGCAHITNIIGGTLTLSDEFPMISADLYTIHKGLQFPKVGIGIATPPTADLETANNAVIGRNLTVGSDLTTIGTSKASQFTRTGTDLLGSPQVFIFTDSMLVSSDVNEFNDFQTLLDAAHAAEGGTKIIEFKSYSNSSINLVGSATTYNLENRFIFRGSKDTVSSLLGGAQGRTRLVITSVTFTGVIPDIQDLAITHGVGGPDPLFLIPDNLTSDIYMNVDNSDFAPVSPVGIINLQRTTVAGRNVYINVSNHSQIGGIKLIDTGTGTNTSRLTINLGDSSEIPTNTLFSTAVNPGIITINYDAEAQGSFQSVTNQPSLDGGVTYTPTRNSYIGNILPDGTATDQFIYWNGFVWTTDTVDTSQVSDTTNVRYVTDAQLTVIGNTSGTNTGDEPQFGGTTATPGAQDGVVPDDGVASSGRFLKDDGTWAEPGGGSLFVFQPNGTANGNTFVDLGALDTAVGLADGIKIVIFDFSQTGTPGTYTKDVGEVGQLTRAEECIIIGAHYPDFGTNPKMTIAASGEAAFLGFPIRVENLDIEGQRDEYFTAITGEAAQGSKRAVIKFVNSNITVTTASSRGTSVKALPDADGLDSIRIILENSSIDVTNASVGFGFIVFSGGTAKSIDVDVEAYNNSTFSDNLIEYNGVPSTSGQVTYNVDNSSTLIPGTAPYPGVGVRPDYNAIGTNYGTDVIISSTAVSANREGRRLYPTAASFVADYNIRKFGKFTDRMTVFFGSSPITYDTHIPLPLYDGGTDTASVNTTRLVFKSMIPNTSFEDGTAMPRIDIDLQGEEYTPRIFDGLSVRFDAANAVAGGFFAPSILGSQNITFENGSYIDLVGSHTDPDLHQPFYYVSTSPNYLHLKKGFKVQGTGHAFVIATNQSRSLTIHMYDDAELRANAIASDTTAAFSSTLNVFIHSPRVKFDPNQGITGSITITHTYSGLVTYTPSGASPTVNLELTQGGYQQVDLTAASGTATLNINNPEIGRTYKLEIIQHATVPVSLTFSPTMTWPAGTAPVQAAANTDLIEMTYNGTSWRATFDQAFA